MAACIGNGFLDTIMPTLRTEVTMSVNGITTNTGLTTGKTSYSSNTKKTNDAAKASSNTDSSAAAVYEKSDETETVTAVKGERKVDSDTIAKLKADAEERMSSLRSLVEKMMTKQGQTIAKSGVLDFENGTNLADVFKNLEVDEETRAQAQKDTAEDGYWGAEQTSERILSFAKALAGDDPDAAKEMISAIQKGFDEAAKAWGEDLPELSQNTMKLTLEKANKWLEELG